MEIIKQSDSEAIQKALKVLEQGGILIYPTETCYGVGVDATNPEAVTRVLKYKKRPEGKPISIGCSSKTMASRYVELNPTAEKIYKNFLPGPVTVISKSKGIVDTRLESETGTLGIRIPKYDLMLNIIEQFDKPITTTSANSSGKRTPYSVQDILDNISGKQKELIDLIIDAGELPHNPPSTVIDTTTEELKTYRAGGIGIEDKVLDNEPETYFTYSPDETIDLASDIMKQNLPELNNRAVIFLLHGELGAGKTQFVKGLAKVLGISRTIKSPTYTYVDEYKFKSEIQPSTLYHVDAWRIRSKEDLVFLQTENWFKKGNVVAIEWPSVIFQLEPELLKNRSVINVQLEVIAGDERRVKIF